MGSLLIERTRQGRLVRVAVEDTSVVGALLRRRGDLVGAGDRKEARRWPLVYIEKPEARRA